MLKKFLERADADDSVYVSEVREAFQQEGCHPFHCHVKLHDGSTRCFPLLLPDFSPGSERNFVASYVHAMLYNIISSLGAVKIDIYIDSRNKDIVVLTEELDEVFQTTYPKEERTGYGKCLNVNERMLATLYEAGSRFAFHTYDIAQEPPVSDVLPIHPHTDIFGQLPSISQEKIVMGMDIGGTDVKLVASIKGHLAIFKEYDWFPAGFTRAEQFLDPLLMLTRLMRAATCLYAQNRENDIDKTALDRYASWEHMEKGIEAMENAAGENLHGFDAIGLCFPDVVVRNLIVGGETYKTRGMRGNKDLDYELQFSRIASFGDKLKMFVVPEGSVLLTNDGPMAAFTTAVEMASAGQDMSTGFFAHTLGTELGTGWVRPDGSIPEIPLEVYNFIIDLGSYRQKEHEPDDIRSINNFNTGLVGTLQKYACQSGVFRLAARNLPAQASSVLQEAFDKGFFVRVGDKIIVPTKPTDMRKPCLEFFMKKASEPGQDACADIFRHIGESLGVCWLETEFILHPETKERTLFGRMVKDSVCFNLLNEGATKIVPGLIQHAADGNLAHTRLMKELEKHPDYTVAQFAQAVGAVYYGCLSFVSTS
ncbi:hypothetical protein [Parasphaerochaeta coccoides]|uniref:Uncharacterized protein n=1 Tax=Parasphaerochaeta coccoides (strain ATCC BAA-1237 / DSM 17374 / SPN1) TaxID=760011 RepID=F4GJ50_PARC1|nr:hypothetical protein [Parasphaerochaeta coccoides]AEC01345.1 hypothetical protein Spico_0103 [Parasphaerochaeta coccoides DSM 17374]